MSEHTFLLDTLQLSQNRANELVRPLAAFDLGEQELITRFSLVCFSNLVEPGDSIAHTLIQSVGAETALSLVARAFAENKPKLLMQHSVNLDQEPKLLQDAFERWRLRFEVSRFRNSLEVLKKIGARVVTASDAEWPMGFNDLGAHAPLLLYVQGANLATSNQSIALVGSRAVTPYGRWVTKEFAEQTAAANHAVISGGAFGVDAIAHQAALAVGGSTTAVMAGGLDRYYPTGNEALIKKIAQVGSVCAEVPPGVTPTKWRFLQRNRLIAAMSQATVVIEAGFRSGSINTANHAATLGRVVTAVPGSIASASSAGCHRIIHEDKAKLVTSIADVIALMRNELPSAPESEELTAEQLRVFDALGDRGGNEEILAKRSGLSLAQVYIALAQLEIAEYAVRHELKWMRSGRTLKR